MEGVEVVSRGEGRVAAVKTPPLRRVAEVSGLELMVLFRAVVLTRPPALNIVGVGFKTLELVTTPCLVVN